MPVVKKVKGMERDYPLATDGALTLFVWEDIKIVFKAVVEFIKWYNLNQQKAWNTQKN